MNRQINHQHLEQHQQGAFNTVLFTTTVLITAVALLIITIVKTATASITTIKVRMARKP
jgi:hypothetical protein